MTYTEEELKVRCVKLAQLANHLGMGIQSGTLNEEDLETAKQVLGVVSELINAYGHIYKLTNSRPKIHLITE